MSSADKVTIRTKGCVSVIAKTELPSSPDNIQFLSHFNESSTWQLINGISNDVQKLLKYFNGRAIFIPFLFVIKLDLYLNDYELFGIWLSSTVKSTFSSISSLLNFHKVPEVSE